LLSAQHDDRLPHKRYSCTCVEFCSIGSVASYWHCASDPRRGRKSGFSASAAPTLDVIESAEAQPVPSRFTLPSSWCMADDKTRRVPVPDNRDHRRQPSLPLYLNAHPRALIHMTDIVLSIGHRKVCAQPEAGNCLILPASFMLRPVTTLLDIARDESAVLCVSCICSRLESRTRINKVIHGLGTLMRAIRLEHKNTRAAKPSKRGHLTSLRCRCHYCSRMMTLINTDSLDARSQQYSSVARREGGGHVTCWTRSLLWWLEPLLGLGIRSR